MLVVLPSHRFKIAGTGFIFVDPLIGEFAAADFFENSLHLGLGLLSDNSRTARVVAVFSRVADTVPHIIQAALIEQIYDQLHFVHAFEVRHFRLIPRFDERFKSGLNQRTDSAAQYGLLAEQIGFGFFSDGRANHAGAAAADAAGVGQPQLQRLFVRVFPHGDQTGNAAALFVLAADQMPRTFRRDQQRGDTCGRCDESKM